MPKRARVAVVEISGTIERGKSSQTLVRTLIGLREEKKIKAVIINIDCTGGDAAASNYVHMAMSKLVAEKPVVAYVSGMATSGGYMAICPATKIVAMRGTFVGSIGVATSIWHIPELLDSLGVTFSVIKSAPLKDMGGFHRELTEEEKAREQGFVDAFHAHFVSIVAKGRNLSGERVKELATGEYFLSETRGKELGLIDDLGDMESTIEMTCEMVGLPKHRVEPIERKKGLVQRFVMGANTPSSEQLAADVERRLLERLLSLQSPYHRLRL
jgi:protease-4